MHRLIAAALIALLALAFAVTFNAGYRAAQIEFDPNLDPEVVALPACETDAECELLHSYIHQLRYRHD